MSGQVLEQPILANQSFLTPAPASLTAGLAQILARPVDDRARRRAALHVLDWVGCAVLGATSEPGRIFGGWAGGAEGLGPAKAIGTVAAPGGRSLAPVAAMANGSLGNVLEMDDVHRTAILHPGPVVIPAALAAAESFGTDATAFLDAVVRGYEAVIRVGSSMGAGHYRFWHPTATCGPFGSAAAVASLLGLDPGRTVMALGLAGTQAAGPWQMRIEGGMAKQLHTARAAHAGLMAADLASRGLTGPAQILEGPLGLYAATAPDADPAQVNADPDGEWKIFATSVKPWPACRHAHAAIDAALALRQRVDPAAIDTVAVRSYRDALTFCDKPDPGSVVEAKFSLQHAVAVTLLDGPPPLSAFEPAAIADPRYAALRARVAVATAEPFVSDFPRRYGAAVSVRLQDGSEHEAVVPDALGDPENPLPEAGWIGKAETLLQAAGIPADQQQRIVAATLALATGGTIAELTGALP